MRNFLVGAMFFLSSFAASVPSHAQGQMENHISKHRGLPPALRDKGDLLPVPRGYAVRWQGIILAQVGNIDRVVTITQYDATGNAVNSGVIHYTNANQTGIKCGQEIGCDFPIQNEKTWIHTSYSGPDRTNKSTQPARITTQKEIFGVREAFIEVAFTKKPKDLPIIKLP